MFVIFVGIHVYREQTWWTIGSGTSVSTSTSVKSATQDSIQKQHSESTRLFTQGRNHSSVTFVVWLIGTGTDLHCTRRHMIQILYLQKRNTSVTSVRKGLHASRLCYCIWSPTQGKASLCVTYVARMLPVRHPWWCMLGHTQGRNQMCVMCVVKHSYLAITFVCTSAHTQEKSHMHVNSVASPSHSVQHL